MLITVRDLGRIGRFGNQLFLYCFAKGYAEHMGCELQVGDWIGRGIFENANEPMVSRELPQTEVENESSKPLGYFFGQKDIDVKVFAQHQCYLEFFTREKVKQWLKVKPEFNPYLPDKKPYSAAHLRRGDYLAPWHRNQYCEVSDWSYDVAVKEFKIPHHLFKISEGWRKPFPELDARGMGWLPDFLLLRDADYLLRGNSSFSVWASWLGNGKTYSPVVGDKAGLQNVPFVEGNHPCTAGQFSNQSDLHLKE